MHQGHYLLAAILCQRKPEKSSKGKPGKARKSGCAERSAFQEDAGFAETAGDAEQLQGAAGKRGKIYWQ